MSKNTKDRVKFSRKLVALPTWMKIYIVIHVSNLKPYLNNIQSRNIIAKPRIDLKQKENKEAKVILAKKVRKVRRSVQNVRELFVKWKNLPTEETN